MKFELLSELYSEALESPSLELYIAERGLQERIEKKIKYFKENT